MRALVIGYGSIGSRHVRILSELNIDTAVVSSRNVNYPLVYREISTAIVKHNPDYVVICNQTSDHYRILSEIVSTNFCGTILIEKPLFDQVREVFFSSDHIFVAYNLRFHPILSRLKKQLVKEKILSVSIYVGQYLPDWRPSQDYRINYSAGKATGGGVLRDLSHELDYIQWIFGDWQRVVAIGGKYSHLEIESDDVYSILLSTKRCPIVQLQMNYLDRSSRREMIVNTDTNTYKIDLKNGLYECNKDKVNMEVDRDVTYRLQHLAVLNGSIQDLCRFNEGMNVLKLICSIEQSVEKREWVYNEEALYNMC